MFNCTRITRQRRNEMSDGIGPGKVFEVNCLDDADEIVRLNCVISQLKQKLAESEKVLKRLEWLQAMRDAWFCPICKNSKDEGHAPDCEMARLIKKGVL